MGSDEIGVVGNDSNLIFPERIESHIYSLDELMNCQFPDPQWLVEDWIPEGLILLGGRPKIGKSYMALDLGLSIAGSGYFLGRHCAKKKVLFCALEDPKQRIQARIKQLVLDHAKLPIDFCFDLDFSNMGFENLKMLITQSNAEVVIIDTLSRYLLGVDQMDHAQMVGILGTLSKISQSLNVSILLVDHHRKTQLGNPNDPIEDLFGSTGKTSQIDTCIGIYKEKGKQYHSLKIISRDNAEVNLTIHRNAKNLRWQIVDDPNNIQPGSRKEKILNAIAFLDKDGSGVTGTEISTHISVEKSNVSHDLKDLHIRGLVKKVPKVGKEQPYVLVDVEINKQSN